MKQEFSIKELSKAEMLLQFPLINQLSPDIKQKDYERMLDEMLKHGL